jgi:zinc protease
MIATSLPGPDDITRAVLSNGIIILARANFNSPSVVVNGYLAVGSLFEADDKLGLSDFTASALMRGTARRDFQNIYDALESVGANLGFNGATHTTGFNGMSLSEDLPLIMGLLAETLRQPVFPAKQVALLRAQLLTGLAIRAQNTRDMASLAFDQIIYQEHPYRRPEDGYPETIRAISREDLVDFHHKHYGPQGMVIAVVGAIDPKEAVEKVREALGDWRNTEQPQPIELPPVKPLEESITQRVEIPGKSQADIVMGVAGPPRRVPEFFAAALGNSILGQFGLMGRIGDAVREQAGLAYYAYSTMSGGLGPGPWSVSAGVASENVEKVIALIREEIARFVSEPVRADELGDSKANFTGRLPLALESNAGVAAALLNLERYDLGLDYYLRYADQVNAVTVEDVLAAAQKYLHRDKLGIAIAGP